MIYEISSVQRSREGDFIRIRYKGNRAVTALIPPDHLPKPKYGVSYEFDDVAAAIVKRAIDQHETELKEARQLG